MQYYGSGPKWNEDSRLLVEWTNQHGCGDTESKVECNIVIQYMCQSNGTHDDYPRGDDDDEEDVEERTLYLRDGTSTDTQKYTPPIKGENTRYISRMERNYEDNSDYKEGLHETVWWYDTCRYVICRYLVHTGM